VTIGRLKLVLVLTQLHLVFEVYTCVSKFTLDLAQIKVMI